MGTATTDNGAVTLECSACAGWFLLPATPAMVELVGAALARPDTSATLPQHVSAKP
jgi:hypothetical protein